MIIDTLTPRIERVDDGRDPRFGAFLIEPLDRMTLLDLVARHVRARIVRDPPTSVHA